MENADWFKPINDFANAKAREEGCTPKDMYKCVEQFTLEHFSDSPTLQLLASKFARDAERSFIDHCAKQLQQKYS